MLAVYLSPIYILVNIYLLIRIQQWLCSCHTRFHNCCIQALISLMYLFPASSMLIAFFLPQGGLRRVLKLIGNYWLGVLLYLLLIILITDFIRILHSVMAKQKSKRKAVRFQRKKGLYGTRRFHAAAGGLCAAVLLVICAWGVYNARVIHVTPYEIHVSKDGGRLDHLNVVLVADLHLGYNIGTAHMIQMVNKINEQTPDLVVIAGDIFDNEYEALDDPDRLVSILQKIRTKYGVYACYGNHDIEEKILAGFTFKSRQKKESSRQMDAFLEKAGIHLLRDEAVLIDDSFYLYGRPDAQKPGRGIDVRKTAAELVSGLDTEKPLLVIDHEPKELQELADAGVDVDLCGHTHDGQMFPGNLATALIWENSYGYLKKENMHTIVTSGVGLFGPNMRVGTIAEICPIRISFL